MPWQDKGKEASIKVHTDDNAKVTWVGYKEVGHCCMWVPLVESTAHDFHKTVAICRMKDLPEHCLIHTPSHKFKCMHCLNDEIGLFVWEKCRLCILLKSLPDLNSNEVHRCSPGKLAAAETELKRVCEESDISWNGQCKNRTFSTDWWVPLLWFSLVASG